MRREILRKFGLSINIFQNQNRHNVIVAFGFVFVVYCMIRKTWMMEKTINDEENTCFSKTLVTACRRHCTADDTTTRNFDFVCMPTEDDETQRLVDLYESGKTDISEELEELVSNYREEIEVPVRCTSTIAV